MEPKCCKERRVLSKGEGMGYILRGGYCKIWILMVLSDSEWKGNMIDYDINRMV